MDGRIKDFIMLNKENIIYCYSFICEEGTQVVYLFLKNTECKGYDLIDGTEDFLVLYPLIPVGRMLETFLEKVGERIEI